MPWLINSVRLTLFVTPEAQRIEAPSWQDLTDSAPENRLDRRGTVSVESGPFGTGILHLQTQPTVRRIDLLFTAAPPGEAAVGSPTIGSFHDVVQQMRRPWERFLRSGIETVRIALGVNHLQLARSWDQSNLILQESLGPTSIDLENARDFMYRINRPRQSRVLDGLLVNRLATWSALLLQQVTINIVSGESSRGEAQVFAAALETDFSTEQDRREPIGSAQLVELLEELQRLTAELATGGDTP